MLTNDVEYTTVYVSLFVGYYRHGVLHREDGPAVIWEDGGCSWYRYGDLIEYGNVNE